MRYIVNGKYVPKDTFYFCKKILAERKTFRILKHKEYMETVMNNNPNYDYYIDTTESSNYSLCYVKGDSTFLEWFERSFSPRNSVEEMKARYNRSKLKDTMSFEDWYEKNGWSYKSETYYEPICYDIPKAEDVDVDTKRKLFSEYVEDRDTVDTLNKWDDKESRAVLRSGGYTEVIYYDDYLEIRG